MDRCDALRSVIGDQPYGHVQLKNSQSLTEVSLVKFDTLDIAECPKLEVRAVSPFLHLWHLASAQRLNASISAIAF